MKFPHHTIRSGQKQFYLDTLKAINEHKTLMAYAPTGLGKTAAVLTAAIEKQYDNREGLIFFLTSRHSQHSIAIETLKKIKEVNNIDLNVIDIINKKGMCPLDLQMSRSEFESYCYRARRQGTCKYGKVNPLAVDALNREVYHVEEAQDICKLYGSCPYFTSLSRFKTADIIISDYSYIFDPGIREVVLSRAMKSFDEFIVIVDEAHNLPDRAREYGSSSLTPGLIGACRKLSKEVLKNKLLGNQLKSLSNVVTNNVETEVSMEDIFHLINDNFSKDFLGDVTYTNFLRDVEDAAEEVKALTKDPMPNALHALANFFRIWEVDLQDYVRIINPDGTFLVPLDVASITSNVFDASRSMIMMSATLYPQKMYADILGISNPLIKSYVSPFPKDNRLTLVVGDVSTVYKRRSGLMYEKIAKNISNLEKEVPGNIALFFPSYNLMDNIVPHIITEREIIVEDTAWNKNDKSELLKKTMQFDNLLLCFVQGASFMEGIDFKNNSLKAIMIIGLPISPPSILNQKLLDFYDMRFSKGYEYVYILPAFNKVLQSAGRGIRKSEDVCAVLLLDSRFNYSNYKGYLSHWDIKTSYVPNLFLKQFYEFHGL